MIKIKKVFFTVLLLLLLNGVLIASDDEASGKSSDWISNETVASVVKLSSLLKIYTVEGLAADYSFRTINGVPDFGEATVLSEEEKLVHVGTGVIVTPQGLIMTNAHVFAAYLEEEIIQKANPAGNPLIGKSGGNVYQVIVNEYPNHMFVGLCEIERLKKNDDRQILSYIAEKVFWDSDYDNQIRDRALLQIVCTAEMGENQLPIIGENCFNNVKLPYSKLANPFEHDYLETKVRAVGFPGSGDPNRPSKTSGELLGYEDDKKSNILHTSWISNGNSGGGLFYKDKLIGINTWDNRLNASRPIAVAQPDTYWNEFFAYTKYIYPQINLPDFSFEWTEADPSLGDYKNEVFVPIQLVHKENVQKTMNGGCVVVFRDDMTREQILDYMQYEKDFAWGWEVVNLLWIYDIDTVIAEVDISQELAYKFRSVTEKNELRSFLTEDAVSFFDLWCSDNFVYDICGINDEGKTVLTLPRNSKIKIIYVDEDDNESREYSLTLNDKTEQGPFVIKIGM